MTLFLPFSFYTGDSGLGKMYMNIYKRNACPLHILREREKTLYLLMLRTVLVHTCLGMFQYVHRPYNTDFNYMINAFFSK